MPEPNDTADAKRSGPDDTVPVSERTSRPSSDITTPEPAAPEVDPLEAANLRLGIKQYRLGIFVAVFTALTLVATISPESFSRPANSVWLLIRGAEQVHLPQVDRSKFTVLVAELDHDDGNRAQEAIVAALEGTAGIVVDPLDAAIPAGKTSDVEAGHVLARKYLKQSGAKLLIWGSHLVVDGRETINLYLTPLQSADITDAPPRHYEFVPDLVIDPSFLGDLVQAIQLSVQDYVTTSHGTNDCSETAQQLSTLIDNVRERVDGDQSRSWSLSSRISVRLALAAALRTFGTITGNSEQDEDAVEVCRAAVAEAKPQSESWAIAQLQLGASYSALTKWGTQAEKSRNSKEALNSFREAAGVLRTGDQAAVIKVMIGTALIERALTETPPNERRVQEALTTLRVTLRSVDNQREPQLSGQTRFLIGLGLLASAVTPGDHRIPLAEAQSAFEGSLELTRERSPLTWALTETTSGIASIALSSSDSPNSAEHLRDSIESFGQALTVETRSCTPLEWANTQHELGIALTLLGQAENKSEDFRKAEVAYHAELGVRTNKDFPAEWVTAQVALSDVLGLRGNLEHDPLLVCQALNRALLCAGIDKDCMQPATPVIDAAYFTLVRAFDRNDRERCQARLEETFDKVPFDLSSPNPNFSNLVCQPSRKVMSTPFETPLTSTGGDLK